jgi:hypothetical protein
MMQAHVGFSGESPVKPKGHLVLSRLVIAWNMGPFALDGLSRPPNSRPMLIHACRFDRNARVGDGRARFFPF